MSSEQLAMAGCDEYAIQKLLSQSIISDITSHRIAHCIGAYDTTQNKVFCRNGTVRLIEPFSGRCGPDNPDDSETKYRCTDCLTRFEIQQAATVKVDVTVSTEHVDLRKVFGEDSTVRTCPGCNTPATFEGVACAHMHCLRCHAHWCWICREQFSTTVDCYDHMNEMEYVEDVNHHRDTYTIVPETILINRHDGEYGPYFE